jgi:hypothetical protein
MTIRELCRAAAVSILLTTAMVVLAVALWMEGCGRQAHPMPVAYDGPAVATDPDIIQKSTLLVPSGGDHPVILTPDE